MARPEFETIVATAVRENFVAFNQEITTPLGAGETEIVNFYASSGKVCKLIGMTLHVPQVPGATTGDQSLYIAPQGLAIYAKSAFGKTLTFSNSSFIDANTNLPVDTTLPKDEAALIVMMTNMQFDSFSPCKIILVNNTDKIQTAQRSYTIWGIQRTVG